MNIQIANQTDDEFTVGGVTLSAKSASFTRSSLITDEEKKVIKDAGYEIRLSNIFVIGEKEEATAVEVTDKAYPADVIKQAGDVSKAPAAKATIEAVEALGFSMLSDNDFKAKYPNVDIEEHRVEV